VNEEALALWGLLRQKQANKYCISYSQLQEKFMMFTIVVYVKSSKYAYWWQKVA
jgi:hypothetical protein